MTFYHRLDIKLKELVPNCFCNGNRIKKSSWVAFLFSEHNMAFSWAVHRKITTDNKYKKIVNESGVGIVGYIKNIGLFDHKFRNFICDENYDKILKLSIGLKCYVYHVEVPIFDPRFSFGGVNSLPEFTFDGKPI